MTYPHERLAANPHDRIAEHRANDEWLEQRWADPETRVLVVSGTRIRPRDGQIDWVSPAEAPDGLRVLLGEHDGRAWFAVIVDAEVAKSAEQGEWTPLRGLLPYLADDAVAVAPLVFHALGLAEWLFVTRYCPRCGEPLRPRKAGHELVCANGHTQFPRTDPAVIMVVTSGEPGSDDERCLLGRQAVWPEGRFSTLAGFCEPGETLEDAVRREVREEVGITVGKVEYFGNQPWPLPASLMVGFVGHAETTEVTVDRDEIEDARWFTRAEMKELAEAGTLVLPGGVSISRSLVEHWYGGPLPGAW
ncbi:NAD(+) diphosphatase [Nocardioides aquiterrae]|uniref:NAD(+) diphosphatase n=1 Tax=Nocardioides aquiterrae TaxID=203799 RepID=A0ABP4EWI2_9ACTN